MKLLTFVLSVFLLSVPAQAQGQDTQRTDSGKCSSEVKYDRFKDQTTELCGNLVLESALVGLSGEVFSISGSAVYLGTVRRAPVSLELNILNFQMQSGVAKLKFSGVREIYLLTDSQRIVLPLHESMPPSIEVGGTGEAFKVSLSKPFVEALIAAVTVEGRLGGREFRFKETELRKFQSFLKEFLPLLAPAAPKRRPK